MEGERHHQKLLSVNATRKEIAAILDAKKAHWY